MLWQNTFRKLTYGNILAKLRTVIKWGEFPDAVQSEQVFSHCFGLIRVEKSVQDQRTRLATLNIETLSEKSRIVLDPYVVDSVGPDRIVANVYNISGLMLPMSCLQKLLYVTPKNSIMVLGTKN